MQLPRLRLHPESPEFSKLAVGFWRLDEWGMSVNELIAFIEQCLELGITTFDHADIYGDYQNEALFGEVLKQRPDLRRQMELVSKCGICLATDNRPGNTIQHYNTTAAHIRRSVETSLKNLHTDVLDLILIHRPDPLMDATEVAGVFSALKKEGKIRHVGVSNFTPHQFDLLQQKAGFPLITNQVECSLLHTDPLFDGTFDQAQRAGASPMIWSPFAGGRIFTGDDEQSYRVRQLCHTLAKKYDASVDQVALAWLFRLPCNPQPVIGSGKPERIVSAAKAASLELDRQDWFKLLEASRGHGVD